MQLSLLVFRGAHEGKEIAIRQSHFCIGRDESCEFSVPCMAVSRRHAAFLVREDRVLVRDLGSRNGTFVNGAAITSEREVWHNDQLRLGPLMFRILIRPQPIPCPTQESRPAGKPAEGRLAADAESATPRLRLPGAGLERSSSGSSPPEWAAIAAGASLLEPHPQFRKS